MTVSQGKSDKSHFQLEHDAARQIARRQTRFLADGSYLFEDGLEVKGILTARVITCAAWLLELYELEDGELCYVSGDRSIRPRTMCFGVFYAPFTISKPSLVNARGRLVGLAATQSLPQDFAQIPGIFETRQGEIPTGAANAWEIVRHGENFQSVAMNPNPSLLSLRAKRLIDENYLSYPSISRIAHRLKVTPEHLSRQFKRDFEISPSVYLHQLRLADAPLRLARGEEIINVSEAVGYNDLSRFYKQFHKSTRTSPGACQALMKPSRT